MPHAPCSMRFIIITTAKNFQYFYCVSIFNVILQLQKTKRMKFAKLFFIILFSSLITTSVFAQYFCAEIIEPRFENLTYFKNGYAAAKLDGKWGFIDITGEFVIKPIFDEVDQYDFNGFPATVMINNKTGLIDKFGNYIIKPEFDEVKVLKQDLYCVRNNKLWIYLNNNGQALNEHSYDSIDHGICWGMKYDYVYKNGKCGLVDTTGNQATSIIYDDIYEFEGDIYAKYQNKWGLLGAKDQWKLKPEYTELYEFYNGLAIAKFGNKWGLISKDGIWRINNIYDYLIYDGGQYLIASQNDLYGILDISGSWKVKAEFYSILSYKSDKFIASKGDKHGLIDANGNWLCEFMYPYPWYYSHDLFQYRNGDSFGLMDDSGNILRDYEFDEIGYMFDGYASFKENGKYGLIDSLGEIVFEAQADEELYPYDGLMRVKIGSYYGLIDKTGKYIIEPEADDIWVNHNLKFISYTQTVRRNVDPVTQYIIANLDGSLVIGMASPIISYYNSFYATRNFDQKYVIAHVNHPFNLLNDYNQYDYIYEFNDSISKCELNNKVGLLMISDPVTLSKLYTENKTNQWQKKGEYEKQSDYTLRVTEETRNKIAQDYFEEIKQLLITQFIATNSWEYDLSPYDSENESYLISFPKLGDIVLHVPISEAKSFKENKNTCYVEGVEMDFDGRNFYLKSCQFNNFETEKFYNYTNKNLAQYNYSELSYNFKPLDFGYSSNNTNSNNSIKPVYSKDPVDTDIPVVNRKTENTFAVVIGNEKYKNEQKVSFAENDAIIFREYLIKTMGIPENRVHLLLNATLGEMLGEIEWLKNTAKAYEGEAKIIFYYAGHGMPEAETDEAYLLPCDGNSSNSKTGIKLSTVYSELSSYPTISTIILLDACFSGAARDGMLASGRGTRIKPVIDPVKGNMIVLSAASGSQTANPYYEKAHGLFTYFLLAKLRETKGDVTFADLNDYIRINVKRIAIEQNKEQEPGIIIQEDKRDEILKEKFLK
jgi:hypothetical protein